MDQEIKVRRVDFYPMDWLEGTIDMTHVERSVYITICAAIFAQGGPVLLSHVRRLCPGAGFKRGLEALEKRGKIERLGAYLTQTRAVTEARLAADRILTARVNGAYGGRPPKVLAEPPGLLDRNPEQKATTSTSIKESSFLKNGEGEKGASNGVAAATPRPTRPDRRNSNAPHREPIISGYNPTNTRSPGESEWRNRLQSFLDSAFWLGDWGPPPNNPRCWLLIDPASIPYQHLLDELGLRPPSAP